MIDSIYIISTCVSIYISFSAEILSSLFLTTTYGASCTHLAPLASPSQVVPSLSLDDEDPSKALESSSGSSSRSSDDYTPAEPGMANGFLSSTSD